LAEFGERRNGSANGGGCDSAPDGGAVEAQELRWRSTRCTFCRNADRGRRPAAAQAVARELQRGRGAGLKRNEDSYLDTGSGQPRLLPWSGDYADYHRVDGMFVPHHFIGYWHIDGQRIPYVDFTLETPECDVRDPFS